MTQFEPLEWDELELLLINATDPRVFFFFFVSYLVLRVLVNFFWIVGDILDFLCIEGDAIVFFADLSISPKLLWLAISGNLKKSREGFLQSMYYVFPDELNWIDELNKKIQGNYRKLKEKNVQWKTQCLL